MSRQLIQKMKAVLLCMLCCLLTVLTYTEKTIVGLLKKVMGRNVLEILMPSVDIFDIYSI